MASLAEKVTSKHLVDKVCLYIVASLAEKVTSKHWLRSSWKKLYKTIMRAVSHGDNADNILHKFISGFLC